MKTLVLVFYTWALGFIIKKHDWDEKIVTEYKFTLIMCLYFKISEETFLREGYY